MDILKPIKVTNRKGTWPVDDANRFFRWLALCEIDIMEEVGYRPNWVSSAIHTKIQSLHSNRKQVKYSYLLLR